jgi:hypothetical protein
MKYPAQKDILAPAPGVTAIVESARSWNNLFVDEEVTGGAERSLVRMAYGVGHDGRFAAGLNRFGKEHLYRRRGDGGTRPHELPPACGELRAIPSVHMLMPYFAMVGHVRANHFGRS